MIRCLSLLLTVLSIPILFGACAPPTAKVKVSRSEIKPGEPVTVSWETKNAKKIELNGERVEKIGAKTVAPQGTTDFQIVARRGKKEARDNATVKVNLIKAPAPTVTIRADPSAIELGKNTFLKWSAENAKVVVISGLGQVDASGEREISPRISTTYTATASGDGGDATASTRITVADPLPPPNPNAERARTTRPVDSAPSVIDQFRNVLRPVFFDYNKSDLSPTEQEKLRRIGDWLNEERNRSIVFRIEGNCDPRGTSEYNLGLGDRRSRVVKEFLISLGVDPARIETVSYGSEKALGADEGSPTTPPSWANDRRADFIYLRGREKP